MPQLPDAPAFAAVVNKLLADGGGVELQIYFVQPGFTGTEEVILHEGDTVGAINDDLVHFHSIDDAPRVLPMRLFDIMSICYDDPDEKEEGH
jgi:hypothetical protein